MADYALFTAGISAQTYRDMIAYFLPIDRLTQLLNKKTFEEIVQDKSQSSQEADRAATNSAHSWKYPSA